MTRRTALTTLAWCAALAACDRNEGPVEPAWGKEPCAHCSMLLSDRRFGAQLLTGEGERKFFDDLGCLVVFLDERRVRDARAWTRDAGGDGWLDVQAARYAAGAPTPMDFGYEARAGAGLTWEAVRARVLEKVRGRS